MSADVHILKISVPKFIRDTITFNVGRNWYKGRLNYYKKNELLDEEIVQYIKSDIKQISIFDDDYYIFIRDTLLCLDTKYSLRYFSTCHFANSTITTRHFSSPVL